jgi:2-polyprenylphenol 6-hydroxylase
MNVRGAAGASSAASVDFDVAVVGGGLAGACAAALLARRSGLPPARIALLVAEPTPPLAHEPAAREARAPPGVHAPPELRVVALSRASERILAAAQAWSRLPSERLCAYERMCVWHESTPVEAAAALRFDAAELGEPNLGYIAENAVLQRACVASLLEARATLVSASLETMTVHDDYMRLVLQSGQALTARLVVGADGARSRVRAQLQLPAHTRDFRQQAVVATVQTQRPHEMTAWQRFLSSGPLALLPLFDGSCSIVWSLPEERAAVLRDCSVDAFESQLQAAADGVLGAMRLASERRSFPLHTLAARAYVAPRAALIGDAAHVIHPLAGQGANLGLLDAAVLCETVAEAHAAGEDPGALRALRHYEQRRRTHNLLMSAAMEAFQRGFTVRAASPGAWLVNQGLTLVNRRGALRRWFARQALGLAGELPRLARQP